MELFTTPVFHHMVLTEGDLCLFRVSLDVFIQLFTF